MKRALLCALVGVIFGSYGCKKDAPSPTLLAPWQWAVTGMKPGSVAAPPSLVMCEPNGTACAPVKAGLRITGNKLLRLERGVSEFELDQQTHVDVGEGSEILLSDAPRTLELRAGGISLRREGELAAAGPLTLKLVDRVLTLVGRSSVVAHLDDVNRGQLFVSQGTVTSVEPAGTTPPIRQFHPGQGAVLERKAPTDLTALFAGKLSRFRQSVLGVVDTTPPPISAVKEPRGLGTMTARVPGTEAVVGGVRLSQHHVRAVVRDGVAQTEVEEVFQNEGDRVLEGRYVFPLPPDASITGLTLFVGDKPVSGELVEKKRAAAIFKGIVDDTVRPRDPALLEWVSGSKFSLKVFPIPAKGSRKVVLQYQQVLTSDGPRQNYVYPLSFGAEHATPIDDLSIDVTVTDAGRPARRVVASGYAARVDEGAAHVTFNARGTTPDHDFALSFARENPEVGEAVAEPSFTAVRLRASLPGDLPMPAFKQRDRVLVVDGSQSQTPEALSAMRLIARTMLRGLEPTERFALLICDSACESVPKVGLAPAAGQALDDAFALLEARKPTGASDLAGALRAAVERAPVGGPVQVVYLGDGTPSAGELSAANIAGRVRDAFARREVDLRLFGAGASVDALTLGALARSLSGSYDDVTTSGPLAEQAEAMTAGLRVPLIVAPTLQAPELAELEPRTLPNLRLGEELVLVGKRSGTAPVQVTLRGRLDGAAYALSQTVNVQPSPAALPMAARLWAQARIGELEASTEPGVSQQIIDLSKQFRVMSRETSWLVLESEQMFAEFGIKRAPPSDVLNGNANDPTRGGLAKELDQLETSNLGALGSSVPASPADASKDKAAEAESKAGRAAPAAEPAAPTKKPSAPPAAAPPAATPPPSPASGSAVGPGGGLSGSSGPGGLGGIGSTGSGSSIGGGGSTIDDLNGGAKVSGPRGDASVGSAAVSGGTVSNAARVVAGMRAGFRNCYQRGLNEDPGAQGQIRLLLTLGPGGQVANAQAIPNGNLPASVTSCVTARARAAQFDPPEGGNATIAVPIRFTIQSGDAPRPPLGGGRPQPRPIPDDVATIVAGDDSWLAQGQSALDKLQADLASAPSSRKRNEALVRGQLQRGRFVPALAAAQHFVELDPDLPVARELLAYASVAGGDRSRATAAVDGLSENAASDLKAQGRAARAFEALADEIRACAHWRAMAELAPSSEAAVFQALRCRARVMGDREAALRDARAVTRPGPLLQKLLPMLESGQVPAFEKSSGSAGQFEVTVTCDAGVDCPFAIVVTPTGTVFSPWTPALGRSSPTSFAFSGLMTGTYHVLLVGGAPGAKGRVEVRALNAHTTLPFAPNRPATLATVQVRMSNGLGGLIGFGGLSGGTLLQIR